MNKKIVFMGTPNFAVPILKNIYQNGFEISAVYTQQPKKSNRGQKISKSPIHLLAETLNLDIRTPSKLKDNIEEYEFLKKLNPIYKAIELTRRKLDKTKSLIAFIGAPWTLMVYMLNLKNNKNKLDLNKLNKKNINTNIILKKLTKFLSLHIKNQINAGADVVQIFDSWAGLIDDKNIKNYCYIPNANITKFCKKEKIPSICFPKGIKEKYKDFNNLVKSDGINLDYEIDPLWAKNNLRNVVIQGGLDPKTLLMSETEMLKGATKYIETFKDIPYIFNLGHGLLPETDPDRVKKLIEFYRNY